MSKAVRVLFLAGALLMVLPAFAAPLSSYELYQTADGDTLQGVAERFGVTVDAICRLNEFPDDHVLKAGDAVAVPTESASAPATESQGDFASGWMAVVAQRGASIRSKPGSGKTLYRAPVGTPLSLTSQAGSYYGVLMVDGSTGWISKRSVRFQPVAPLASRGAAGQSSVLQVAFRYLGVPYKYGGSLPYNADCSLFVQSVFATLGMRLPRTAAEQFQVGVPVSPYDLQAGDRLYFVGRDGRVNHTGVYVGNGLFIHASSSRRMVAIDSLVTDFYWRRFIGARR